MGEPKNDSKDACVFEMNDYSVLSKRLNRNLYVCTRSNRKMMKCLGNAYYLTCYSTYTHGEIGYFSK